MVVDQCTACKAERKHLDNVQSVMAPDNYGPSTKIPVPAFPLEDVWARSPIAHDL